ncbi:uncharacterized protein LOC111270251 isoform X2 [Varroa jacobsoni]|uniref:uncharacterized protein LOC111270251 isoform X2 n=1 Tax=Varroa jacobsoni TaxID=62625 RepID=UPI000BF96850|nr:uncharacterized protein LOC111270251 isoform X2 [Varroa jacobsoni]
MARRTDPGQLVIEEINIPRKFHSQFANDAEFGQKLISYLQGVSGGLIVEILDQCSTRRSNQCYSALHSCPVDTYPSNRLQENHLSQSLNSTNNVGNLSPPSSSTAPSTPRSTSLHKAEPSSSAGVLPSFNNVLCQSSCLFNHVSNNSCRDNYHKRSYSIGPRSNEAGKLRQSCEAATTPSFVAMTTFPPNSTPIDVRQPTIYSSRSSQQQFSIPEQQTLTVAARPEEIVANDSRRVDYRQVIFRVSGTQEQVDIVREELNKCLQSGIPTESRVMLKMDVSFSDHSFIIGRMGRGSQSIMRATGCHVHFPDSNKNNHSEKSNQVSVTGPSAGVLAARQKIRERLPISLAFVVEQDDYRKVVDWSESSDGRTLDLKPSFKQGIEALQNEFSMTIIWLPMEEFCAVVTVRGRRTNFERIREGFRQLAAFLLPNKPTPIVHLGIEVSPQHLGFVLGTEETKAQALMHATNTRLTVGGFRSDTSHHIPTVRIFGEIDNVYHAWLSFMDSLPVVLCFDVLNTSNNCCARGEGRHASEEGCTGETLPSQATTCPHLPHGVETSRQEQFPTEPVTLNELVQLREMGVVSSDSLTAILSSAVEENGSTVVRSPGFHYVMTIATTLNSILSCYEISLTLRFARDLRHWKIAAKGPEKYLDLLMEIHRAITNTGNHNPVQLVCRALQATDPPPTFPFANASLKPSSMFTVLTPAATRQRFSGCQPGCAPCGALDEQETCEMFATLLNISGELRKNDHQLGDYRIPPADSSTPSHIAMWSQVLENKH